MINTNKSLFIFTSLIHPAAGGIQNTSYLFSKSFPLYFDLIFVVSNSGSVAIESGIIDESYRKNKFLSLLFTFKEVKSVWKSKKQSYFLSLSWRTAIIPFLFNVIHKVPYGVMLHGNEIMENTSNIYLKNLIERKLRKTVLLHARNLFANSNYTASLAELIVNKKINVIHPPIERFHVKGRSLPRKKHTVFSIGRLEYRKGFQLVIEAIEALVIKYPNIEYRIAGDGPYRAELEKLIKSKKLEKHVFMLGKIKEHQKINEYQQASIFVMPSFINQVNSSVEGFGIVYIEANAFGCPVIGTDSGGIPDAIIDGKTGWIINEKNVPELVTAIQIAFEEVHPDLSEQCKKWAELHEYPNIVKRYIEIINS